jgi:two-component system, OmpR family, sensor kinase
MLLSAAAIHFGAQWFAVGWKGSIFITFVCTWLAAGGIAVRLARPFDQIAHVATALGKGDLAARVRLQSLPRGEPRVLGQVLNEMAARLEQQVSDQRALLAMVSHEIRTPLARMQLQLEAVSATDATKRESARAELEREILEMDDLIGQLLATTRIDMKGQVRSEIEPVAIAVRALEAARISPECLDADENLGVFQGDPTLILRALINVLQNANTHGMGVDSFQVRATENDVRFEVQDKGPGIAPVDLGSIFEPFVHREPSATRTRSIGLGLSLVKRIAEAHGGSITAENRDEASGHTGARFVLRLPRRGLNS